MHVLERPSANGRVTTETIDTSALKRRRRLPWKLLVAALVVVALVAGTIVVMSRRASAVTYTAEPVTRGTLVQTVTATGTVNAQNVINVGTQASGTISELDVDYNSHVHKGQVLARLDPTTFQDALNQAKAQLAQAEAQAQAQAATAAGSTSSIAAAQATEQASTATADAAQSTARSNEEAVAAAQSNVTKAQSALALAQQTVNRDAGLLSQGYVAQNQVDSDRSALVAAQTTLASAQTAVSQAKAQAAASRSQAVASNAQQSAQAQQANVAASSAQNAAATHDAAVAAIGIQRGNVAQAQENLSHTVITSPVDGTVISRGVSIGQTVAASFQTPTLFSIAQDLRKMQVEVAVGEPDIGSVKAGDAVDFTVLAYPNTTFHGTVSQVRQNPTTVSNVVTYDTVVLVGNQDGKLRPGMTANASIHVAHVDNAVIVPLAALQYVPPSGAVGAHHRRRSTGAAGASSGSHTPSAANASGAGAGASSPWGGTGSSGSSVVTSGSTGRVFVQTATGLHPVPVRIGMVSGVQAAVTPLRGALSATDAVVIGDSSASTARAAAPAGNPFAQQQGGGGRRSPMGALR